MALTEAIGEVRYWWDQTPKFAKVVIPIELAAIASLICVIDYEHTFNEPQRQSFKIEQYSPNIVMVSRGDGFNYKDAKVKAIIDEIDSKCRIAGNLPTTRDEMFNLPVTTQVANCTSLLDKLSA